MAKGGCITRGFFTIAIQPLFYAFLRFAASTALSRRVCGFAASASGGKPFEKGLSENFCTLRGGRSGHCAFPCIFARFEQSASGGKPFEKGLSENFCTLRANIPLFNTISDRREIVRCWEPAPRLGFVPVVVRRDDADGGLSAVFISLRADFSFAGAFCRTGLWQKHRAALLSQSQEQRP